MEISFAPSCVSRPVGVKSSLPQVSPELINILHVEDHPPLASGESSVLEVDNGVLRTLRPKRRETGIFPTIKNLQTEYLVIKVNRPLHITYSYCNGGYYSDVHIFSLLAKALPLLAFLSDLLINPVAARHREAARQENIAGACSFKLSCFREMLRHTPGPEHRPAGSRPSAPRHSDRG